MSDRSLLSPTGLDIIFGLLGLVAIGSALLVVTTRQIVHAGLWLVVSLGAVAGCFLLMSAEFVAWMQVLIYVGAVVVLLLFGLMLTRGAHRAQRRPRHHEQVRGCCGGGRSDFGARRLVGRWLPANAWSMSDPADDGSRLGRGHVQLLGAAV